MWGTLGRSLPVFVLILALGACWSRHEIDRLALVMTVGIDQVPDGVMVTIQFPTPGGQGGNGAGSAAVASATGRTLDEAGHRLLQRVGRFVTWTHLQTVMFGAPYARQGIRDALDFLLRLPEVRDTARILVADGPASGIIAAGTTGEILPGTGFREVLVSALREGFAPWTEAIGFAGVLAESGIDPVTPVVHDVSGTVVVSGVAVFRDDRLVGFLDEAQTRGLMAVIGKGQHLEVPMNCPGTEEPAFLRVDGRKARVEPVFRSGRLTEYRMTVLLTAHPSVMPCRGDPRAENWVNILEQAAAREVQGSVLKALERARELQADIFGLGLAALRRGAAAGTERTWGEVPVRLSVRLTMNIEGTLVESSPGHRAP